jgi:hypothetical protein
MDVDGVMLLGACDDHAKNERYTPEIMHPESLLSWILDPANQSLVSNDKEIIDVQKDCREDDALCHKDEQSTVHT